MIKLNINEDLLKKINEEQARAQYQKNWYYYEYGEKDKKIRIGKNTLDILKANGCDIKNLPISYNTCRDTYTIVEELLKENECFFKLPDK